ncbi:MAG: STAS/SEC14 domain-containing protein [Candidatus Cyclobacteriaceae bacterium M2_1C_046]
MFTIISEPDSNTIALRISAAVTKEDYELTLPRLRDKIKTQGKINLYCEIDQIASITPGAVWEDIKFDVKHLNDFKRVGVVGSKARHEWMTNFGGFFTSADVKYFDESDKAKAMDWVVKGEE